MNMKGTSLLLMCLWGLSCSHPVVRHQRVHHRSSEESWPTASEERLNKAAHSADTSDRDSRNRLDLSLENRGDSADKEHKTTSHEDSEGKRKFSSDSLENLVEDISEWSTQDNDEGGYFRIHQAVRRKWAESKDSQQSMEEMDADGLDDHSSDRVSMEDENEIQDTDPEEPSYSDIRNSKEQQDAENDGMLYIPDQVSYTFTGKVGRDLINDEDFSGDGSVDENINEGTYGKGAGPTVPPNKGDEHQHSKGDGDSTVGRHHDDSSSSSSSESRSLDLEDNRISRYSTGHKVESYSSSQEDRYDFDDEGMQGDDPQVFERDDSDSSMLQGDVVSKESSQEIGTAKGKGKRHSKSVERFARKVYHYVDGDSDEEHSPERGESTYLQEDDGNSKEDSQSVEDIGQSIENVPGRSREHAASHSREAVQSSSRGHSQSQSRENINSQSREDLNSQSRENKHSQSREDMHSQSKEGKHSQSREDKHSRSREDKHSRSREDKRWSREDVHSQSREDVHSRSRQDVHSRSREDVHSQSREDVHSQSGELIPSQSREDNDQSREEDDTVSVEDLKSESIENSRASQEKPVKKYKERADKSEEHSASRSKEHKSSSTEEAENVSPRSSESRQVKRHHSRSSEKSSSTEESEESKEDIHDDSRLSQSESSESDTISQESTGSEDSNESDSSDLKSEESQLQHSRSEDTSESNEGNSHSLERDSKSREDTLSRSDSTEDDSWSRSNEVESRKLMLDIYHNKPYRDYEDNDCQDGY